MRKKHKHTHTHIHYDEEYKAPCLTFNSLCRCWRQINLPYYKSPREEQRVWEVEKEKNREKKKCWMFKGLLLVPEGIARAAMAQGSWLVWPIMGAFILFPAGRQEAPGSKGWRTAGTRDPTQCNTSSARLEGSCAGSIALNSTPWLPACKQTYLRCTRHRGVWAFILLQPRGTANSKENCMWYNCWVWVLPLYTKIFNELNAFPSAGVEIQTVVSCH